MTHKKYYVTTPIYYVNDLPHIGHTYTTVLADILARYKRLLGYEVFFLTGTDEHGQKAERAARERGIMPKELADTVVANYYQLWDTLQVKYDRFIRTTEPVHHRAVQKLFRIMMEHGDIYKGHYEGWYCWACEAFVPESQLVNGKCPDCGKPVERVREPSYFFRLSKYQRPLLDFYNRHPDFIRPESRFNEVVRFVEQGLKDLSISRVSVRWGIPVPDDDAHVIYVWVDALTNYISALGWAEGDPLFERYWPADLHLVGKDILRFHCIYWPAFLMSAGIELPHQVFGHGWWLRAESKMSKSVGNIVRPGELLDLATPDMVRYYLAREAPLASDSEFSHDSFIARLNADLANDFGNLIHRTFHMVHRYHDGRVPAYEARDPALERVRDLCIDWVEGLDSQVSQLDLPGLLKAAWEIIAALNGLLGEREPWRGAKDPQRRPEALNLLGFTLECLRLLGVGLYPVMPGACSELLRRLQEPDTPGPEHLHWGLLKAETPIKLGPEIFPRIATEKPTHQGSFADKGEKVVQSSTPQKWEGPGESLMTFPHQISIEQFMNVELRVGEIVTAEPIPKSKKLLLLKVDIGGETRQMVAGIAREYRPEDLVGRKVVVVTNLQPARLMGYESQGMILAADVDGRPYLVEVPPEVPNGSRVR